jgi:hypothetical protein
MGCRGVFKAKDRHSCEGRNPEYSASINLDARPHLHGGRLCAGMTEKTPRPLI